MISGWLVFGAIMIYLLIIVALGLIRRLAVARLRAITVGVSAIAAIITTLIVKTNIISEEALMSTLLSSVDAGEIAELLQLSPSLVAVIHGCATALVAPALCLVFFMGYSMLLWIPYLVLVIVFRKGMKEHNEKCRWQLLRAAGAGLLEGLAGVFVIMIPLVSYLNMGAIAGPELIKSGAFGEDAPQEVVLLVEDCQQIHDGFGTKVFRVLGVDGLSNAMTTFKINDEKIHLKDELGVVASLVGNVSQLSQVEMNNYSAKEAETFDAIADTFDQSVLLPTVMGEFMFNATEKWMNNEAFMGMEKPALGENELFNPFMDELIFILHTDSTNIVALKADVHTIADMISILANNGLFSSFSSGDTKQLMNALSAEGVVSSLVTTLGNNASMKRLVPQITNLGIRAIGQTLGIPEDVNQIYGEFIDDVVLALNEVRAEDGTVQIEKLTEKLEKAFDTAGVDVDTEILDFYSASMVEDLVKNNSSAVTEADVQAFFAMYADYTASSDVPVQGGAIGVIVSSEAVNSKEDKFKGSVYENKSEEEMENTAVAKLAAMCVTISKLEDNEDFAAAAEAIVIATFADIVGENEMLLNHLVSATPTKPISSESLKNTAGLQSSDEMQTQKITMDKLLINVDEAAEKITGDTVQGEADAINAILSSAGDLLDMDMENMDLSSIATQVGGILDSLSSTETFGDEKTADLFTAVFQSDTVRDSVDLDMSTATQMAQKATEGSGSYTDTLVSVSQSVEVLQSLNTDKELSEEELAELIRSIKPQTAAMLEVYATPKRMIDLGTPEPYAEQSSLLLVSMFSFMGREDLQNYDAEAKALNQILNIVLAAKDDTDNKLFSTEGQNDGRLPSEKETLEILMNSHAVTYAVVEVLTDGTQVTDTDPFGLAGKLAQEEAVLFEEAMREYYAEHPETNLLTMQAIAAIFGMSIAF